MKRLRSRFWAWWDTRTHSYAHAHTLYVRLGPTDYDMEPCWCKIGEDHE